MRSVAALVERGIGMERVAGLPLDSNGVLLTPEGAKVAWFRDPDGNLLSVVQYAEHPMQRFQSVNN
jgi:hypothetical protein